MNKTLLQLPGSVKQSSNTVQIAVKMLTNRVSAHTHTKSTHHFLNDISYQSSNNYHVLPVDLNTRTHTCSIHTTFIQIMLFQSCLLKSGIYPANLHRTWIWYKLHSNCRALSTAERPSVHYPIMMTWDSLWVIMSYIVHWSVLRFIQYIVLKTGVVTVFCQTKIWAQTYMDTLWRKEYHISAFIVFWYSAFTFTNVLLHNWHCGSVWMS